MSWYHYAACRAHDPELFFPIGVTGSALHQLEQAKRVCAGCPVQSLCLEWAVLAGIDHGVWGGLSEDERRAMRWRAAGRSPFQRSETGAAANGVRAATPRPVEELLNGETLMGAHPGSGRGG